MDDTTNPTPAPAAGEDAPQAAAGAAVAGSDEASELQRQRDEFYDLLLRKSAEFDNYRKRIERERREWTDGAAADVIRELLPVLDDFERALSTPLDAGAGPAAVARYRDGVDLIRRQLTEVLRRHGVEPFDAVGRDFDPEWHEAVTTEPVDGHRDGEITAELRRGYRIGQRLLRPAMVKVAKS
jgi:molecular chaperone GrpE